MDRGLDRAEWRFVGEQHVRNVFAGSWVDLFDEDGNKLAGIRARVGAAGPGT